MFIVMNQRAERKPHTKLQRIACAQEAGFTLLEILIALFVFSILATLLTAALHRMIVLHSGVSEHASKLRALQFAFVRIEQDMSAAIPRGVKRRNGGEEVAFLGDVHHVVLTRMGKLPARITYEFKNKQLLRYQAASLDSASSEKTHERQLLTLDDARFQYVDQNGRIHTAWPLSAEAASVLPRAVQMKLTVPEWGEVTQTYVITATQKSIKKSATTS